MKINIPGIALGLLQPHTSYKAESKGSNNLFLPIPYAQGCKITFENEIGVDLSPKYHGINFRRYPKGTLIETFSEEVIKKVERNKGSRSEIVESCFDEEWKNYRKTTFFAGFRFTYT